MAGGFTTAGTPVEVDWPRRFSQAPKAVFQREDIYRLELERIFYGPEWHLLAHRSVLENVMIAEVYRGQESEGRAERALAALERVQLGHRAEFLPTRLSGGERQRVAIARALTGSPELLLCDELTGNLDSHTAATILDLIQDLGGEHGPTIIMITHDRDVAARAGRQVRIVDGVLSDAAMAPA